MNAVERDRIIAGLRDILWGCKGIEEYTKDFECESVLIVTEGIRESATELLLWFADDAPEQIVSTDASFVMIRGKGEPMKPDVEEE